MTQKLSFMNDMHISHNGEKKKSLTAWQDRMMAAIKSYVCVFCLLETFL